MFPSPRVLRIGVGAFAAVLGLVAIVHRPGAQDSKDYRPPSDRVPTESRSPGPGPARGLLKCALTASGAGYSDSQPVEFDTSGDVEGLVLNLSAGGGLFGVVEDEDRRPVPGATVRLRASSARPPTAPQGITDASGRFFFRALSPGDYFPSVAAQGFSSGGGNDPVSVHEGADLGPVTLRIARGWILWGRVLSRDGQPIGSAEIEVTQGAHSYSTQSKPDGSFRLEGIAPDPERPPAEGVELLKCQAPGFGAVTRTGLPAGRELTLVLEPGGGISVSVALSEGPAPKTFSWMLGLTPVRTAPGGDSSASQGAQFGMKGPRGQVQDLAPGTYDVEITASGRQPVRLHGILVSSGSTTPVEALLNPGRSDAPVSSLRFKDAAGLREQLRARMSDLEADERQRLIDFLRSTPETLPVDHPTRRAIEEVLKDYPK